MVCEDNFHRHRVNAVAVKRATVAKNVAIRSVCLLEASADLALVRIDG